MSKISQNIIQATAISQQQHEDAVSKSLLNQLQMVEQSGMKGEPLPYRMQSDWAVTSLILLCFILLSMAVRNGRRYLEQHLKGFFLQKERASIFFDQMSNDFQFTLLLGGVTCILWGLSIFNYYTDAIPNLFTHTPSALILSIYIGCVIFTLIFKRILYGWINWIFFDNIRSKQWMDAYFDILVFSSFLLFPFILLVVYFGFLPLTGYLIVLSIFGFTKILLFYKCIRNFFVGYRGLLHLILYFCALEIIPDLILWKGIEYINSVLI